MSVSKAVNYFLYFPREMMKQLVVWALEYATPVGKVWLPVLFLVRVLTLVLTEMSVWTKEHYLFLCNTHQTGCSILCYDKFSLMTFPQYWFLQLLLVICPTVLYLGISICQPRGSEPHIEMEEWLSMQPSFGGVTDSARPSENAKYLYIFYMLSLISTVILESGCLVGQWFLLGFKVEGVYTCEVLPCPHKVDCFVPGSTRKSIFIIIMAVLTGVSIILTLIELILQRVCKKAYAQKFH
ncbi:gap junction alpha-4 protein-like [Discoglossus pictus]